jgi:hypothetical protein
MRPAATASLPAAPRPAMAMGALDEHGFGAATRGERRLEDHPALALAVALCRSKPCASGPTAGAIRGLPTAVESLQSGSSYWSTATVTLATILCGNRANTPTVDRYLAARGRFGAGLVGRAGRPPLMIRCCAHNRRSDGGRRPQRRRRTRPLAGRAGGAAGPGRGPVPTGGTTPPRLGVRAWAACGPATQELLDDRRACRGRHPRWDAAPAGAVGVGPRRGPR